MFARKLIYCLVAFHSAAFAAESDDPLVQTLALPATATELHYSTGALQIGANYAWSKGATGKGVVVGVLDTGVWGKHPEFGSRVLAGYDFVHNQALSAMANSDDNLHGTHVAGIIAAGSGSGYMTGVAPDAYILPVKVMDAQGSGNLNVLASGLDYARSKGAKVVNLSLGWNASSGYLPVEQALRRSVAANQVVVAAAGNDGAANPSWPARYASQTWANGQIIAVGAVDANNKIASFSNRAGDTKNYFLVAPGVSILSTIPPNIAGLSGNQPWYAYLSGTSMATPYVSGAVALLEGYWPQLKANQVTNILFTTATDLGDPGVDAVYGRGLINLNKAMQPIGTTSVPTTSGTSTTTSTKLVTSSTLQGAIKSAAAAGAFRTIMVDSYNRDYRIDLGAAIASAPSLTLSQLFSGMDAKLRYGVVESRDGTRFAATYSDEPGKPTVNSFSFTQRFAGGDEFSMGTANFASQFMGLADTPFAGLGLSGQNLLDTPFIHLSQAQTFAGYGMALQEGWNMKAALFSGSALGLNEVARDGLGMPLVEQQGGSTVAMAELSRKFDGGKIAVSVGQMAESDRILGSLSSGAFAMNGTVSTSYFTTSGAYRLGGNTWAAGSISVGNTSASGLSGGMISGLSGATSYAWTASLLRENAWRKDDKVGFSISQPLGAVSGTMLVTKATGVNVDGSYQYSASSVRLNGGTKETDYELDYTSPLNTYTNISAALMYRANPGNDATASDEAILGLRWQHLMH
ncbi:putative ribosome biogenesis GTPase RsgA [Novimethylophilus kurashikiensis]|uniref:Putative ribosome biogenesis GTPase RsgA n=1 Tax=Novimethylophilus kurashikiensis TaxID=1825523 RepID=A0A2R5F8R1_9PROT|nr:S8 family serine peptidase [Novimethylophilus kurashikiensis]GBG14632.1 putative ribosome biogenesis GTPase RsgA [Novimethylophilus kurashikiensis]